MRNDECSNRWIIPQLCITHYEFLIIRSRLQNNRYRETVIKTGHGWQSSETIANHGLLIKCEIMNVPTDVLPHNYAFRIPHYELISHFRCEKCGKFHTFRT